jgi:UTP-glucose-1-phosphate uridylyltransferase
MSVITKGIEKPLEKVKGKHAVIGRYLFKQSIFNLLEEYNEKEIGLSNVIFKNVKSKDFIGCKIQGKRFDIGNIDDYYKTIVNIKKRL